MNRILRGAAQIATKYVKCSWGNTRNRKSLPKKRKIILSYNGKKPSPKKYVHRTGVLATILSLASLLVICKIVGDNAQSTENFKWLAQLADTALMYMVFTIIGTILAGVVYFALCAQISPRKTFYTRHSRRTNIRSFKKRRTQKS